MCFDLDSRPPIPPIAGGAIDSEEIVLRAGDGGRFAGLLARAEKPTGADARSARRPRPVPLLRGAGAPVRGGRHRGARHRLLRTDRGPRRPRTADDFEYMPHVGQTTWAGLRADIQAGVGHLRGYRRGRGRRARLRRSASASAAGSPSWPTRSGWAWQAPSASTAGRWARGATSRPRSRSTGLMTSPVLGLFGGADPGIPADAVETFEDALAAMRDPPRGGHLPGRPAQLLRPQGRPVRRHVDRRLGARALVRPNEHARRLTGCVSGWRWRGETAGDDELSFRLTLARGLTLEVSRGRSRRRHRAHRPGASP